MVTTIKAGTPSENPPEMSFLPAAISRLRTIYQSPWGYPLFLFIIGFLTYLYPLLELGYYWDDWEVVYLTRLATPKILESYFFFDRPLAWPYPVFALLLGGRPFLWQLLTYVLRWAGTLFFYQAFLRIWPKNRSVLQWSGMLLVVYPAFLQQMIATAFSRHFTAFMLCGISFYFTTLAMQARHSKLFWILSWLTGTAQIFTIEYFAGLELVRPIMIWFLLGNLPAREKFKRTVSLWLPFLAAFLAFGWWRIIYYPTLLETEKYVSRARLLVGFQNSPVSALASLAGSILRDFAFLTTQSWIDNLTGAGQIDFLAASAWFGIVLATALASMALLLNHQDEKASSTFTLQSFLLGMAALVGGGIPFWVIEKQVSGGGSYDNRFALGPMVGAILVVCAMIMVLVDVRWRSRVFALLLAFGILTQAALVNTYRREWANERNFFWQVAWRMPSLKPGTAVLAGFLPSRVLPDYDASFALALLYSDQQTGKALPYWYYTWEGLQNVNLKPGAKADMVFRNLTFTGSLDKAVMVFHQEQPGCVRVADKFYTDDPALGQQNDLLVYSDLSRIEPSSTHHPPEDLFGPEPDKTWCYFFQKADLARQMGNWRQVIDLYRQAENGGFKPVQGGEYLPLVEALAQTGDWNQAVHVSEQAAALTVELLPMLCDKWSGYGGLPGADPVFITITKSELNCP